MHYIGGCPTNIIAPPPADDLDLPFQGHQRWTDYSIRSATHDFLLLFYSNYSAISNRNTVFQQMTLIWPFNVTKGQTDYSLQSTTYDFLLLSIVTIALSRTKILFFSRWPWSDLSRSPKVKLIVTSDPQPMTSYYSSIVTKALSCAETVFFSRWPWSDLSRSPKVKLIIPSNPRPMTYYYCSVVNILLSLTETMFFRIWPWSDPSRSPKVKLIMPSDPRPISSYWSSVDMSSVSRTVFELFDFRDIESWPFTCRRHPRS